MLERIDVATALLFVCEHTALPIFLENTHCAVDAGATAGALVSCTPVAAKVERGARASSLEGSSTGDAATN